MSDVGKIFDDLDLPLDAVISQGMADAMQQIFALERDSLGEVVTQLLSAVGVVFTGVLKLEMLVRGIGEDQMPTTSGQDPQT